MDDTVKNRGLGGDDDDDDDRAPARGVYQQHDVDGPRSMEGEENTSTAVVVDDDTDTDADADLDAFGPLYYGDDPPVTMTPLVQAVLEKEPIDTIQRILDRSPHLMQQRVNRKYPLSHAVEVGSSVEIVKALCKCWPKSVRVRDDWCADWLPLHHVGADTPVETVEFLVDACPGALLRTNGMDRLPLHTSIDNGASFDAVKVMADRCPDESFLKLDGEDRLPIHSAVLAGRMDLVEYLADRCPASLLLQVAESDDNRFVWTIPMLPIHLAANTSSPNRLRIVQILERRCPESLSITTPDGDEELAIHCAAVRSGEQQLATIDFLATQRPETLLAQTSDGCLPVHRALQTTTRAEVIERLARASIVPEATRLGLLHFAVREIAESYGPVRLLDNVTAVAEAIPAALRGTDSEDGSLPIHLAVHISGRFSTANRLDVVRRLVDLDPGTLLIENAAGELPLHKCIHAETAEFLLESCPQSALVAGRDGVYPIHSALSKGWFGVVKKIVGHYPHEARRVGARRETLMHVAATLQRSSGRNLDPRAVLDVSDALIRAWPESLLERDADGYVPIHIAVDSLDGDWALEFVTFLIDRNSDSLRVAAAFRSLPLHMAAARRIPHPALVRLLVERWDGALVVRDARGRSPLQVVHANWTASLDVIYVLVRTSPVVLREGLVS